MSITASRSSLFRSSIAAAFAMLFALPLGARAEVDKKTERLWRSKCASCHGSDGKAATDQGKKMAVRDLTSADWQKEFSDEQLRAAVRDGLKREKNGVKQEMDPYKDKLNAEQIDALVKFMRDLKK